MFEAGTVLVGIASVFRGNGKAILSGSCSMGAESSVFGKRDRASGSSFSLPGQCSMSNVYSLSSRCHRVSLARVSF